jgi:cytochrome c-type biogenesis protein CcmH
MNTHVLRVALVIGALLSAAPAAALEAERAPAAAVDDPPPGERELLGRLVAPCCWTQTLDVHAGGAPDELRAEIRQRLRAGESPASIEADFVARYGERVRASGSSSSLGSISLGVIGLSLVSAIALVLAIRRWARASSRPVSQHLLAVAGAAPDALDARIDDELRDLE